MKTPAHILDFKAHFPLLINKPDLVYFDNAATTQKPQVMLDAIQHFYQYDYATVHRSTHTLSSDVTHQYEESRKNVAQYIGCDQPSSLIWTKGTTESINLVATILQDSTISSSSNIVISDLEHHANLVPWQQLCQKLNIELRVANTQQFQHKIDAFIEAVDQDTYIVACSHVSNALGITQPIKDVIKLAKKYNALSLIDGAQAVCHLNVDVNALDCDFYVFSAHKMYGPTGLGCLYIKPEQQSRFPPYQFGGEMVKTVNYNNTVFNDLPHKYEAGTPNIEAVIAFGAVIQFLQQQNLTLLQQYESELTRYLYQALKQRSFISLYSPIDSQNIISFTLADWHPHDVSELLNNMNIAVRVGTHCAQPVMQQLQLTNGTIRLSLCAYNTYEDAQLFLRAIDSLEDFI
ncbi:aminotransferase class V-fold PLP-dependent enzyme [Algibacillus agarilyticus]|uniref:aminotransferase class V-fold PLP-dependent enzyme n=1 Tax=Algibacillus agarilyticus TaxID=2234133 RepID=UPI000DCF7E05|nr:cysteine desulfurase [Algibacillus agarilyticus]